MATQEIRREIRELEKLLETREGSEPPEGWVHGLLRRCLARRQRWLDALSERHPEDAALNGDR